MCYGTFFYGKAEIIVKMSQSGYFIEPDQLEALQKHRNENIVIVDLCTVKQYEQAHIPNAHYVEYADIKRVDGPVIGRLPSDQHFSALVSRLGISNNTLVIAYDDVSCGCAARFIWTLHVFGHEKAVVLNGGLHSWINEGHELSNAPPGIRKDSNYRVKNTHRHTTTLDYIQSHMSDENVILLDTRSEAEYKGDSIRAKKTGHIPSAVHYEWTMSINQNNNDRRLSNQEIQAQLNAIGIHKDKEIICYCQSHHRSSYTWLVLKHLGYEDVLGYPGSWSEWGNHPDTLVE